MTKRRPGLRQRTVLYLEPKRAVATILYSSLALAAGVVVVAAGVIAYSRDRWQPYWDVDNTERAIWITTAVAGCLALLFFATAIVNGRRWSTARVILRLSNDPALASLSPATEWSPPGQRAAMIPPLDARIKKARQLPKPRERFRRVTLERNVVGHQPLQIAFLRLFENQPRMRTFIEGAWREFGYVYLLRSAASVTPAELRLAKRSGSFASLFVSSRERVLAEFERRRDEPYPKRSYKYTTIGARTIRVRDKYGAYPILAMLCHGSFWQTAVDILLDQVDLVVFDLSGLTQQNAGTRYELQRVVDRFPIERVVFLADQRSNRRFLTSMILETWQEMAEGSPNEGQAPRVARVVITDYYAQSTTQSRQGQTTQVQVRLVARRRQTRRVASFAQDKVDGLVT